MPEKPDSWRRLPRSWPAAIVLLTAISPLLYGGIEIVHESSPNLAIPDNSCLDDAFGRGEGGVVDSITFTEFAPIGELRVEVEIDHSWRQDLQFALGSATSATARLEVPAGDVFALRGSASSTPVLANGHDSSADNYYAIFTDLGVNTCASAAACGSAANCTGALPDIHCRPDETLLGVFPSIPRIFHLRICDREASDVGILRRWVVTVGGFIPVELQSFTIE